VARQSIPRSDLYGDLGVDPSADAVAIEAAYRNQIDRLEQSEAAKDVRRAARLRLAHEWLTDPERRGRYDASRAKAAARAEKAADVEARELAGAASGASDEAGEVPGEIPGEVPGEVPDELAGEEPSGNGDIPWPTRDLERPAGIQWSATPEDLADDEPAPKRRSRLPLGALGLVALAAVVMVGTYVIALNLMSTNVATNPTASPPEQTVAVETASSQPEPTVVVTAEPTTLPTPAASEVPPEFAAMQQSASATIVELQGAAAAGDVAAAQAILGDSAPGLRASGLRRATFPELAATDISVQREGELYVALAGADRLTSLDGQAWTFDYGDRPLAAYKSPGAEPIHDLWWVESDGEHHLFLRVSVATISRSGVTADVSWSFDPSRPDDATYFRLAGLVISTVALDGVDYPVTDESVLITGSTELTLDGTFDVEAAVAPQILLGITVANPRNLGGDPRLIDTGWTLTVR
jgi:hypothetical protein